MTSLADIVLLGILGAAFHYLAYRAAITSWLWSRYPQPVDKLLSCSACSGFWVGGGVGLLCWLKSYPLLGPPITWITIPAAALVTMIAAPPISFLQIQALLYLGGHANEEER